MYVVISLYVAAITCHCLPLCHFPFKIELKYSRNGYIPISSNKRNFYGRTGRRSAAGNMCVVIALKNFFFRKNEIAFQFPFIATSCNWKWNNGHSQRKSELTVSHKLLFTGF